MSNDPNANPNVSPVNPMPPVVVALFLVILGVECVFALGSEGIVGGPNAVGWRLQAVQEYAFFGSVFELMVDNNHWPVEHLMRFVTYPFISHNFTHALLVGVILLAMGKMVGEAFGGIATLVIFVGSGAFGALAYAVLLNDSVPLIGGFPPVYGLIGGFTFLLWRKLSSIGAGQLRAFHLIGFLMGIQLIFGLLFDSNNDWVADLAGFVAGFSLSFFLAPGSWSNILRRLRGN